MQNLAIQDYSDCRSKVSLYSRKEVLPSTGSVLKFRSTISGRKSIFILKEACRYLHLQGEDNLKSFFFAFKLGKKITAAAFWILRSKVGGMPVVRANAGLQEEVTV